MQLAAPDIDRMHEACAAVQQHFGEAAGRRADVEADLVVDLDRIALERARKLDAAARHPRVLGLCLDLRVGRNFVGGLQDDFAAGCHQSGGNRSLCAGAAFEQAARDQQAVGALPFGHVRRA